jgi:quercetin dioxygenase-like cupin family protein
MELKPIAATAKGTAERFAGDVYITPFATPAAPSYLSAGIVRFAPGARTNWHVHPNGQTLHVLEGIAMVGTRDGAVVRARAGETVVCPPGVEHWHGASPDTLMASHRHGGGEQQPRRHRLARTRHRPGGRGF